MSVIAHYLIGFETHGHWDISVNVPLTCDTKILVFVPQNCEKQQQESLDCAITPLTNYQGPK